MTKCVGQVTRSKVRESIIVKRPKDIIAYQQHMGGVDYRYQHRLMGGVFVNVLHFKNCYTKAFWGIACFILLKEFTAWKLAVNIPEIPRIGGQPKFRDMIKWGFYSISPEEMMIYVDNE